MALTSTISSSMIAVSSILSYDLYKTYMNPKATDKRLMHVSHLSVCFHALFITAFSLVLNYGGADMTWIGYFRPILTCPGIIPLAFTLTWSGQTRLALVLSPILGFVSGIAVWLATAKTMYGRIDLWTTEQGLPALYGSLVSLFSPALYSVLISQYKPTKFDWRIFLRAELLEAVPDSEESSQSSGAQTPKTEEGSKDSDAVASAGEDQQAPSFVGDPARIEEGPEKKTVKVTETSDRLSISLDDLRHPFSDDILRDLRRWHRIAWAIWVVVVLVTFVLWPMPLYRDYIFTKSFFSGWTTVAIIWQFIAFLAVVVYPVYDGWKDIKTGARGVWHATQNFINKKRGRLSS
ncbi:hypothetical protein VTN31DRAFT_1575 [Thermomyces dupontii]|uniref:uncharacterized protein n=1 Tax=Talaromyces thermophilus TaxID=28565 RepID=UPI00374252A5